MDIVRASFKFVQDKSQRSPSMFKVLRRVAATATVALAAGCGGGSDNDITRNIVQQAQADARLSTLVEAVTAADLGGTLSGAGPFTVFAPTLRRCCRSWA
jgi:uncharacterized surface protein with fasciclin (FAS1) repeats